MKTTRTQRKFEKMSHKRGLVVNFEHVTQSRIRPIEIEAWTSTIKQQKRNRYNSAPLREQLLATTME